MADILRGDSKDSTGYGEGINYAKLARDGELMNFMEDKEIDGDLNFNPFTDVLSLVEVYRGSGSGIWKAFVQTPLGPIVQIETTELIEALEILGWEQYKLKARNIGDVFWPEKCGQFDLDNWNAYIYIFNEKVREEVKEKFKEWTFIEKIWEYLFERKEFILENVESC